MNLQIPDESGIPKVADLSEDQLIQAEDCSETAIDADFALFTELVALDRFRAARRTGELDVLASVDDPDGPDTHGRFAARTERKKRTRFERYRLRLHVPSQQR